MNEKKEENSFEDACRAAYRAKQEKERVEKEQEREDRIKCTQKNFVEKIMNPNKGIFYELVFNIWKVKGYAHALYNHNHVEKICDLNNYEVKKEVLCVRASPELAIGMDEDDIILFVRKCESCKEFYVMETCYITNLPLSLIGEILDDHKEDHRCLSCNSRDEIKDILDNET